MSLWHQLTFDLLPPDPNLGSFCQNADIVLLYPPASAGGESATFPRMFSSYVFFLREEVLIYDAPSRPANRLRIGRNVCDN
jgi:hypothetical protein